MDDRAARERAFHDARFHADTRPRPADRFYAINRASRLFYQGVLDAAPTSARLLEYGCGEGAYSAIHAAQRGHDVTAIDISPVALKRARERAVEAGVTQRIDFRLLNGEQLDEVADRSYDLVCGTGVLHHLDLERALPEIARVLTPSGGAVFVEPLAHNPLLRLYRHFTPAQRTADEHPLRLADIDAFHQHFSSVTVTPFHLAAVVALPLRHRRIFEPVLDVLDAVDRVAFRTPLRRWAWLACIHARGPLRPASASE